MKKLVIVLMLSLLLVGCGKHDAQISNANDVIWTENGHNYTSSQLNENIKQQDFSGIVIRDIIEKIAVLENIDTTTVKANVDKDVDAMLESYGEYYFQYYGTTVDEYRKSHYADSLLSELMKIYVNGQFDFYKEDFGPYKAEIAYFDELDAANAVIEDVNGGEHTFAYSALEHGFATEITEQVYTDQSDLPIEIKDYAMNTNELGLSNVIQSSTVATDAEGNSTITPRYYIMNLVSKDVNEFKDDFISWLISNALDSKEIINNYMTKYNVKFYDQRTYELIKETYGDYH